MVRKARPNHEGMGQIQPRPNRIKTPMRAQTDKPILNALIEASESLAVEELNPDSTEPNPTRSTAHTPDEIIRFLWTDDLRHALASVVSLVSKHASARESAEWSVLWQHCERVISEREDLLTACKAAQRFLDDLEPIAIDNNIEPNSNSGLDWDTRFIIQDAIAKANQ